MPIHNIKNRLQMYAEATWGTKPGAPVYVQVPHYSYGVQFQGDRRNAATQTGLRQRKHGDTYRGMPTGTLVLPLYAWQPAGLSMSLAQWMIDWGLADPAGAIHEDLTLPSRGAEYAVGPDQANKEHTGLRPNSTSITGNGDSGTIQLSIDLRGKDEVALATAQSIPTNMYELTEFCYEDSSFSIDGTAIPISSFTLTVTNNLLVAYIGQRRPTILMAGERVSTLQVETYKDDDTWDQVRRDVATSGAEPSYVGQLKMKGLHKGTGTAATNWSEGTFDMPWMKYAGHNDVRDRGDISRLPLSFDLMKPDTLENDINVTWVDAA